MAHKNQKPMIGLTFGDVICIDHAPDRLQKNGKRRIHYKFRCLKCGHEFEACGSAVRYGFYQKCTHVKSKRVRKNSREYRRYISLRHRLSPQGLVSEEFHNFQTFLEEVGTIPEEITGAVTLAMKDPSLGLVSGNCYWEEGRCDRNRPFCKLNYEKAQEIRKRKAAGERAVVLAEEFGVTVMTISLICTNKTWNKRHDI